MSEQRHTVGIEAIARAADEVADGFMDRYRSRPQGHGERFYDLYDAFSTFAAMLRNPDPTPDAPPHPASRESEQAAAGAGS